MAASLAVRLWFVASGQLDLVQDEAQYWDWSRRLQWSYYSKGPLIAWFISLWTRIFGPTELGVRIGAVINATLAQIILWYGVSRLMGKARLAVLCLVVANTMPLFLATGVLMTTDNLLLLCWLGGLLCLYALSRPASESSGSRAAPLVLLGLCMAAGNLAKYMMLAQFAVAIAYFLLLRRHDLMPAGVAARALAAMAAGTLIGCLPILVWNMQNGWVGLLHVSTLAGVTGSAAETLIRLDTVPEFLGAQFGVTTPWWMLLMLVTGWRAARLAWHGPNAPEASDGGKARETSGTDSAARVRLAALLASSFWPLWLGLFAWSFHTRIYANWPGMCYVGGIILAAAGLERLLTGQGSPRACRLAVLWPALGLALCIVIFGQNALPLPPELNPASRLKGWADLGDKLDELTRALPNPDKVFYFGEGYDVTAELAFYAPGQPAAYSADFGRRRSQYDLWPGPDEQGDKRIGWDAIFVSTGSGRPWKLYTMFDSVTFFSYQSTHRGKPGRLFTIALLRNFNGTWPHSSHAQY
ncbi:MAG: glycosyltransferase family 39 protein [Desulfovibrionaceae bacterium]|nr:glycosyltransferase family 39 protein [Desulfovibrionaceae bacterium]